MTGTLASWKACEKCCKNSRFGCAESNARKMPGTATAGRMASAANTSNALSANMRWLGATRATTGADSSTTTPTEKPQKAPRITPPGTTRPLRPVIGRKTSRPKMMSWRRHVHGSKYPAIQIRGAARFASLIAGQASRRGDSSKTSGKYVIAFTVGLGSAVNSPRRAPGTSMAAAWTSSSRKLRMIRLEHSSEAVNTGAISMGTSRSGRPYHGIPAPLRKSSPPTAAPLTMVTTSAHSSARAANTARLPAS
mmetsp:Transcript_99734/g.307663  ORF Transcript_99734/g.307663 Transcript_99734/m.307663 type:complete len:251 (+) Transcript_99734:762-1514(+)